MKRKEKCRVAVLVSGGGSNLEAIIEAQTKKIIKHGKVCLVISSNPDAFALIRARNHDIPCAVVSKKEYPEKEDFEGKIISLLEEYSIELVVLAGFLSILGKNFIDKYEKRIINIHPSLIPSFCGKGMYGILVHKAALDYGVKVTGATVHYVNEVPDGGEIILQRSVYVKKEETPESLQQRVMRQAEWIILPRAVEIVSKRIIQEAGK